MEKIKTTKLKGSVWFSILLFGLIGQIAWIVENMYFAKFMQNKIEPEAYATTLMVILSAVAATVASILGGGLCDRTGKRKVFISYGYILWGISVMAFAFIPLDFSPEKRAILVGVVVIMDIIMSFIGAVSNDAAFNTWITDITDTTNRGKVDVTLAIMPLVAIVVVFVGLDSLTSSATGSENWAVFFLILGAIPIVGGILGIFLLKDSKNIVKDDSGNYWKDIFFGFRPNIIKENKMLYVCLAGCAISGASLQVFQAYLINIVEKTFGVTNYILPLAAIIILAAVIAAVSSALMDKYGKSKFYYPTIIMSVVGGVILFCAKFVMDNYPAKMAFLLLGGIPIMASSLMMAGLFVAAFRDYIPKGKEGSFQGVRMCMYVLIPMIIGPLVGQFIINTVNLRTPEGVILYPPELFLGATVIICLAFIPSYFVKRNDKIIRAKLLEKIEKEREEESNQGE